MQECFDYIKNNQIPELAKYIVSHKLNVNEVYMDRTVLMVASSCNRLNIVNLFVEKMNADVNYINSKGYSALLCACGYNHTQVSTYLVEHNADVNVQNVKGNTPLILACLNNNTKLASTLISHGANINSKNNVGMTPLLYAIKNNNIPLTELLISSGANLNSHDNSPLIYAVKDKRIEIVNVLLEHGAKPNIRDSEDNTPIFYAIISEDLSMVMLLYKYKANINVENIHKETPIMYSIYIKNHNICTFLIDHNAELDGKNSRGENVIDIVKQIGFSVSSIIEEQNIMNENLKNVCGEHIKIKKDIRELPVMIRKQYPLKQQFKEKIEELKRVYEQKRLELHDATRQSKLQTLYDNDVTRIQRLYEEDKRHVQQMYEDRQDNLRERLKRNIHEFEILLAKGANVLVRCINEKYTHLYNIISNELFDLLEIFLKKYNINIQDTYGCTTLFYVSSFNNIKYVERLLNKGADAFIQNYYGSTAISEAYIKKHYDVVRHILSYPHEPKDPLEKTPRTVLRDLSRKISVEKDNIMIYDIMAMEERPISYYISEKPGTMGECVYESSDFGDTLIFIIYRETTNQFFGFTAYSSQFTEFDLKNIFVACNETLRGGAPLMSQINFDSMYCKYTFGGTTVGLPLLVVNQIVNSYKTTYNVKPLYVFVERKDGVVYDTTASLHTVRITQQPSVIEDYANKNIFGQNINLVSSTHCGPGTTQLIYNGVYTYEYK